MLTIIIIISNSRQSARRGKVQETEDYCCIMVTTDNKAASRALHQPSICHMFSSEVSSTVHMKELMHLCTSRTDVEFASSHRISAQEAVDVAIAPVLDEAVVALSQPHTGYGSDLDVDLDNAGANPGSGWSSPVPSAAAAAAVASTSGASGAGAGGSLAQHLASRSPTRHAIGRGASTSQSRSFSPDSNGGRAGDRATSPGSATSTSFSIGTPPDHDAASQPFSQHLSEALEKERKAAATPGSVVLPPPVIATPSKLLAVAGEGVASPNPSIGSHGEFEAAGSVAAGTPSAGRRLSFISYAGRSSPRAVAFQIIPLTLASLGRADVINEERLAELTGAPVGGPEPHALAPGGTGGAVDLAGVLDRLELSFGSSGASHGTGTGGGTDETVVRS